ncbi:MAG TPA: protein kinase [Candidatus Eisenbacteria bacterium]
MALAPGSRLGPYEVLAPLGSGGMGEVYRSRDSRLGRDVALKVIPRESSQDSERIRRFEQEARAAGTLSHPNVCAIYDLGSHEGSPFVVMELLEGESLREILHAGPVPLRKALEYAAQAAEGLAAAHAKGIVHRDLKPENLFVTKEGRVKVLDFGLAKLTGAGAAVAGSPPAGSAAPAGGASVPGTITSPGVVLGTLAYMAPEQIRGAAADARADVFALGVVLYEMLTARRPFEGATQADAMSAILQQDAAPLSTLRPDAPAPLTWFLRRCLAKDPDRRVQTALDVRNEVEEILREIEHGTAAEAPGDRRTSEPEERKLLLTAAHVRQLSVRNPRLIGYPLSYLDNQVESETLVVMLHGVGGDHRRFEAAVRTLPYRGIAITLAGFAPGDTYRPALAFDDHSRLVRTHLAELVRACRPAQTILVGFSAGADQFLRMLCAKEGLGVDVAGLVALGTNVSLETCFVSRLYAKMNAEDHEGILASLKSLGEETRSLSGWLVLQAYITQTFMKLGSDLEPLRRYSADVVAPFEAGGDPLPGWYRAAKERIPSVRFVFSDAEAGPAEAVLTRHLEQNVLGDRFTEASYVTEPVAHSRLPEPGIANRYVESVVAELAARRR